ncbi:MAG: transposase [Blastocatellia bacterium]
MSSEERARAMELRRRRGFPPHSPPHWKADSACQFLISSACYQHEIIIGKNPERMAECEGEVLEVCRNFASDTYAWCILPNHYHVFVRTEKIKALRRALGQFHGRSSFTWNGQDVIRGRKVWHNCFERPITSERHFWATLNYVHHNPVHHGYVEHWQDWVWSSGRRFLERIGREKAAEIWRAYPILDYGKKWDT